MIVARLLQRFLCDKRVLLVLNNFEHRLDAADRSGEALAGYTRSACAGHLAVAATDNWQKSLLRSLNVTR